MVATDFSKKLSKAFQSLVLDAVTASLDTLLAKANSLPEDEELDLDALVAQVKEEMKALVAPAPVKAVPEAPQKKAKKVKVPGQPKGPLTAFFLFSGEVRQGIKEAHPEAKVTDISKLIGEQWKSLSETERKKYEKKAVADKARYEKEMAAFKAPQEED